MKFTLLSEPEMVLKAKAGNLVYLDLLLSRHEDFLLKQLSSKSSSTMDLLTLRQDCQNYVRAHFRKMFDEQKQPDFATWLSECVKLVISD